MWSMCDYFMEIRIYSDSHLIGKVDFVCIVEWGNSTAWLGHVLQATWVWTKTE